MIPQGYRLLTAEDIGKVFGVDLELVVHIDTSVTPNILNDTSAISNMFLTNFLWYNQWKNSSTGLATHVDYKIYSTYSGSVVNATQVDGTVVTTNVRLTICDTSVFKLKELLIREGLTINSYYTDTDWNNFFYVKDITNDPYSITIKNKEGIKLLTKNKDIHFDDDVKITIDESLLGGGGSEETGYTLTLNQYSNESKYKYYPFGDTSGCFQYRINGGEWQTFANAPITIENVRTIQFFAHAIDKYGGSLVVKQNNNVNSIYDTEIYCTYDYTDEPNNAQSFCMCLIEDITLYIGGQKINTSGGGGN